MHPHPYAAAHNAAAIAWKRQTSALPDAAREPGPYKDSVRRYDFCLPREFAAYNLLPTTYAKARWRSSPNLTFRGTTRSTVARAITRCPPHPHKATRAANGSPHVGTPRRVALEALR